MNLRRRGRHCLPGAQAAGFGGVRAVLATGVLALAGCVTVGPEFEPPETTAADRWSMPASDGLHPGAAALDSWWTVFADPVLDELVREARLANPTLEIAALAVLEARAQLAVATGLTYPQTQVLAGNATWVDPPRSDLLELLDVDDYWQFSLGASIAWEADFWGRYRRTVETAEAAFLASEEAYNEALVLVTAQVAASYITIRELEEQLRISRDNVAIQQRSYDITEVLYRNGSSTELDMQQARTLLLSTEATIPAIEAGLRQARNALSVLLGRSPGAVDELLTRSSGIPALPAEIAVGIPADALRRRPDVRRAEYLAMAANAQVGLAEADLYPSFTLTGAIGLSAGGPGDSDFGDLFEADSLGTSLGVNFVWPFLNYGRIRNNVRVQDARLQQALVGYRATVLSAAREAEDAMAGYVGAVQQAAILAEGVDAAQRSNALATLRYREGFSDYQRVLDSQQRLFGQQQRHVTARGQSVRSLVGLFTALGGGWEGRPATAPLPDETIDTMRERTDWGDYFEAVDDTDGAAASR